MSVTGAMHSVATLALVALEADGRFSFRVSGSPGNEEADEAGGKQQPGTDDS